MNHFLAVSILLQSIGPAISEERPKEDRKPPNLRIPQTISGERFAYTVYVEAMEGKDLDEKIEKAILLALSGGIAAEVILPPGHLSIKKPIRL